MLYLKIFIVGWGILVSAIVLNIIANQFNISTWFSFFGEINKLGFLKAFQATSPLSKLFLFVIYPFLLGLTAYLIFRILLRE